MRVSILIMAFLPPFRAFTSASSSFLSFSKFMARSCSWRNSSARRAASTMARAALSSDSLASLVISSRSALSWLSSASSFLLAAVIFWLTLFRSARVSLVSASSCSALRRWRSAVSRRARASSRPFCMAAAFLSAATFASEATDLGSVLLDGGLGLGISSDGVLQSNAKIGSISLQLLLHPHSLGLALALSLQSNLHRVKSLGLCLLDQEELLLLLSKATLNLLPHGVELELAAEHLVLLLLQGGLGLLQSRL